MRLVPLLGATLDHSVIEMALRHPLRRGLATDDLRPSPWPWGTERVDGQAT